MAGDQISYLLANKMGIRFDSHNGSKGQCAFIQRLEEIGKYHDRKDSLIDQSLQPLVLRLANIDSCGIGILCKFFVHTAVVHVILLTPLET